MLAICWLVAVVSRWLATTADYLPCFAGLRALGVVLLPLAVMRGGRCALIGCVSPHPYSDCIQF